MSLYDPFSDDDGLNESLPKPAQSSNAWMLTVADLFSLMLTFFVLLYSMSVIQKDRWEVIAESLFQRLNTEDVQEDTKFTLPQILTMDRERIHYARSLSYLYRVLAERLGETAIAQSSGLSITLLPDRIILSLNSNTMFDGGSAKLKPSAKAQIDQIGQFLSRIGNSVLIEGHTDPEPIRTAEYPSNWELSLARAATVANTLRSEGYPYQMTVEGLGSSRFNEWQESSETKRPAHQARRVEIIIRETVAKF